MHQFHQRAVPLSTGVTLNVAIEGDPAATPVILLHGFPESHRTWRHQIPELARDHYVIAPDQRGYATSSKPPEVDDYAPAKTIADIFALADALGIDRFTLIGHDWGGGIAWGAAIGNPARVARLVILNAPHPAIFQRTLHHDAAQQQASGYMTRIRTTRIDRRLEQFGITRLLHSKPVNALARAVYGEERALQLDQWTQPGAMTAMLNWYRASALSPEGAAITVPVLTVPTLVIWGMRDKYLLPSQLDGLEEAVADLTLVKVPEAGHFIPWRHPDKVNAALRAWLGRAPTGA